MEGSALDLEGVFSQCPESEIRLRTQSQPWPILDLFHELATQDTSKAAEKKGSGSFSDEHVG
jgi:hypothetical protein